MISGIVGLGHILITVGLIAFIAALGNAISESQEAKSQAAGEQQ